MPLTWEQMQKHAFSFAKKWQAASNEEADAQGFITAFLAIFGVEDPRAVGDFERKVALDEGHKGYFDYLWPGYIAIEMKSAGKDLAAAYKQLANYVLHLETEQMPDLLMVSDFQRIELRHRTTGQCTRFNTANLPKYVRHFAILAGYEPSRLQAEQVSVDVQAAEKTARLHDALKAGGYTGHALEVYLVRLLFCFFAEDTGLFPKGSFQSLVENSQKDGCDLAGRLTRLFEVLNTPEKELAQKTLLPEWFRQFRYVNGGLFADTLPTADFNAALRQTLLECCDFDWSGISPAIFGAMFQGVLDAQARRELGAHYTSEDNILKVIRPLFLDALWEEFERVRVSEKTLAAFHEKISRLRFLDPACGCGNFLIVAYRELRTLELEILKMMLPTQLQEIDIRGHLKVSVSQFAGMDIEDFPCQIAQVGMWLMDHLMNLRVSEEFGKYFARLPLKEKANIRCCNALEVDWNEFVPVGELSYILGNPPFIGYAMQSAVQKRDMATIAGNLGKNLYYVACWFLKTAQMMQGTGTRAALVATNSITQGEQVAGLWHPLFKRFGVHIDFAHRTFRWDNEGKGKAHVHCVIVGFSATQNGCPKVIFDKNGPHEAKNINAYLLDAPNIFVQRRNRPLCAVPSLFRGSQPTDGGNLILTAEEKDALLAEEPQAQPFIRPFMMGKDFIDRKPRFCLWLLGANPTALKQCPQILARVAKVRAFRLASSKAATRAKADTPMLFDDVRNIATDYIAIPQVSSEARRYVPVDYLPAEIIAGNMLFALPEATLFHFGVLTSSVHMAWMRAVCGRLKSDYRYSKDLVYNTFPWSDAPDATRTVIERNAQAILDARALFPDASLADLYDELTMPPELRKAHQANDRTVLFAYGLKANTPEPEIVAKLMERYQELVEP